MATDSNVKIIITNLNSKGHIESLNVKNNSNDDHQSPKLMGLKMQDLRMFTLLTGKNRIGKSNILKSIKYKIHNEVQVKNESDLQAILINFHSIERGEANFFDLNNADE